MLNIVKITSTKWINLEKISYINVGIWNGNFKVNEIYMDDGSKIILTNEETEVLTKAIKMVQQNELRKIKEIKDKQIMDVENE